MQHSPPRRDPLPRRFLSGVGLLGSGLRLWVTDPRLMLTGAIPALIVALVYAAGIVALVLNADGLAAAVTPFANDWGASARDVVRAIAGFALLAVGVLIVVFTFAAVTLAIGGPFYEAISRRVEARLGNAPEPVEPGFWASVARGLLETLRVLATTAGIGIALFALGFIPLVGQTLVPVLAAVTGGWFLTLELTAFAFESRGISGRDKRRMLSADRARTLGLGVATYLVFLIPFAAVVVMPAAVAAGTRLARETVAVPAEEKAVSPAG
jgi:CysZ protein